MIMKIWQASKVQRGGVIMFKKWLCTIMVVAFVMLGVAFADQQSGGSSTNNNSNTANASATGGSSYVKDSGNASVGNGINNFSPSAKSEVDNKNVNVNRNSNKQAQGQLQGQVQGQIAQGEVSVTGDTNKVFANSWPSVTGAEGVSSGNAATIFGSLGLSQTEKYKKIMPQLQAVSALVKDGMLTPEEGRAIIQPMVEKLVRTNKTQRLLGILWETDGRNLLNGFGILAWDSVWKDGPAQGVAAEPKPVKAAKAVKVAAPKTVDEGVTGNGGVLVGGIQK